MGQDPNAFLMPIEDVFVVKERGTIVVGPVKRGSLTKGDMVEVIGLGRAPVRFAVSDLSKPGLGAFAGLNILTSGDYGGIFLPAPYDGASVGRGMVVVAPGSIDVHQHFNAIVTLRATEQGGLKEPIPLIIGYTPTHWFKPDFYVYDIFTACLIEHPSPKDIDYFELLPEETAELTIHLLVPLALELGSNFQLRSGPRVIGEGIITSFISNAI